MATIYDNAVQQMYVAYFNRPADATGLAFWTKAITAANGSTAAVATAFSQSAEYTNEYKGMTNAQIVDQVYQNLFGRGATDSGAKFWIDGLDKKTITIADVVTAVAAGAQGTDKTAFNNKVIAATQFTDALDTAAEKAGYSGDDANAIAKDFLAGITTNATLSAAIEPANLNTVVAGAVAAGTEFTVVGALASLDAANDAKADYLKTITPADATATWKDADVESALTKATTAFTTEFAKQAPGAGGKAAAYEAATSASVKAAILNDQISANVEKLSTDQKTLTTVKGQVAEVTGLASAITKLDGAIDSSEAAGKTAATAATNLTAQEKSFEVTAAAAITKAGGVLTYNTDGSVILEKGATDVSLIDSKDGALSLHTGVTEKDYPGITALLNSLTADLAAKAGVINAAAVEAAARANVDKLDVDPSEAAALAAVKTAGAFDSTPSYGQAQAKDAALAAAAAGKPVGDAAKDAYDAYHTKFAAYETAYKLNPLYTAHTAAADNVEKDTKAITDFNKVVADLNGAQQHVDALAGYDATIDAASDLFGANDYNLVSLDAPAGVTPVPTSLAETATASSDVYVVTADSLTSTISLFGLQGNDSIFIGEGYTVNTGKLTTGNDAKLELFIAQSGANTVLQVETSTFGSNAATAEVVKITLVGVTATDVHLDANGLITVGDATA